MLSTIRQRLGCLLALAAVPLAALAAAQSVAPEEMQARTVPYVPPPLVKLRTEVEEVEVPVVVRDGRHRAVAGLTRDNFEIYATGKKQTITAFSVERFTSPVDAGGGTKPAAAPGEVGPKSESRPRFVALCFDDLNMDALALKPVKEAAQRFVKTGLAPGDRVAVVTAAQTEDSQFIADVPKLVEQIANVTSHQSVTGDEKQMCPRIRPNEAYLIVNHLDKEVLLAKISECEACWHDQCPPLPEPSGARLRGPCARGVRCVGKAGDRERLPRPAVHRRNRHGGQCAVPQRHGQRREALASDTITDLPVRFTWEQWEGAPNITMVAHLDVSRLHFETRQDRRAQRLTMVAVLLDARGGFVTGKRSELSLSFTEATFAQLAKAGFTASLTLKAPPGSYGVRAVVQDALEGKVTAAGGSVQVK